MIKQEDGYYELENVDEEELKQSLRNLDVNDEDLLCMEDSEIRKINGGWITKKMYNNTNYGKFGLGFDFDLYYPGFITNYSVSRIIKDGKPIYYLTFYCTVKITELGIHGFTYQVNANYTTNSYFTNLLFDLGFNPSGCEEFNLDSLINLPIYARFNYCNGYTSIYEMRYRRL